MRSLLLALLLFSSPALAQEPAWLNPDQVRVILTARGFSDVQGLEREGPDYVVREAKRYGQPVGNLRLDALTGLPRETPPLTDREAEAMLRDRGYTDVEPLGREGDVIRLRAKREGAAVELAVDARTGAVRQ
ncbi:hypothetical protein JYK14_04010 [Siccirubricoccus sp. KC 17139]|uniref:PepSY domain-containing protein n=1 Tax=Siccirubricoccus soli TaxID=2899147 RepID=A0ABT1D0B5_9PROT|nr:hypothetical protein [Siccirubricoccus soli]MCO6415342.1 hypothetical protein [Siccirubricoccus soli]MCP2681474.1 hypothetical protein [Siccirubricoccus soli]